MPGQSEQCETTKTRPGPHGAETLHPSERLPNGHLPPIESVDLRAACAHWLRSQGLSDHEVAAVLGLARVRSVDRLLRRHAALDAQRAVREVLAW